MTEYYTVNFDGQDIYKYEMKEYEVVKVEELREELMDICNKLKVPRQKLFDGSPYMGRLKDNHDFHIKYKEDIGYFVLLGERGKFTLQEGFPTYSRDEAKLLILESEFSIGGFQYELELRNELEEAWAKKYSVKYDSRKEAFEYTIRMIKKVFKTVPDRIVSYYTKCMNRWFQCQHWYYDENEMCFKELD